MNADERDEIAAAVAAHGELGARYDSAIAEGLIERIGEEIDKRVEERLRRQPTPGQPSSARPAPGQLTPPLTPPQPTTIRRNGGVTGMILGLGSMGIGIGATAVVVIHDPASVAQVLLILLIWAAIAVVNVAHSRRQ
ncbi:MAG: hypothetical protein J2P25_12995 [Nocardiopsaceae bacterium]|nr:hypothetical protein [Nocardiopsaceae bacterium]